MEECANVRGYQKELDKYMGVEWADEFDQEFDTALDIDIQNHQGALADLANVIAGTGSNIRGISTEEKDGRLYTVTIELTVKDRKHLAEIMRRIRVMPHALKVRRHKN